MKTKLLKSPWLELFIMIVAVVVSHIALAVVSSIAGAPAAGEMATHTVALWLTALFTISFAIAVIGVIGGIGGGVIFTPVMLAFTPVNSLIIRPAGLIVAMISGLIASGLFLRKGLGHFKMCLVLVASQGLGALIGAQVAIAAAGAFGQTGEGVMRIALGILLVGVAVYFFTGGKKSEWPNVTRVDALTNWMHLDHTYLEESDGKVHTYRITRIAIGLFLVFIIGFIGGFFGLGAGWALTPVQNLVLGAPLKAAVANSSIILAMVDCVAVWPYFLAGGLIPLFILPLLSGQIVGGLLGAIVMAKIKVAIIRIILIGIMVFTSFGLVTDGLATLSLMKKVSSSISITVFVIVMIASLFAAFKKPKS